MVLSKQAMLSAHYETAYHTLCAAMHYACDLGDTQRIARVEQAAKTQLDWVNTRAPENRMSSQSAINRQGVNMYDTLARQAATQVLIAEQKHRRDSTERLPWLGDVSNKIS